MILLPFSAIFQPSHLEHSTSWQLFLMFAVGVKNIWPWKAVKIDSGGFIMTPKSCSVFDCFFVQSYRKKIVNKEATFEELASRYSDCSSAKKVTELIFAFMFNKSLLSIQCLLEQITERCTYAISCFHPSTFPNNTRKVASNQNVRETLVSNKYRYSQSGRTWFVNIIVQENNEVFEIQYSTSAMCLPFVDVR